MGRLWMNYRAGIVWAVIYVSSCLIIGNMSSPACEYPPRDQSNQCTQTRGPKPLHALLIKGVTWIGGWQTDEYIAFGTLLLALFTYMLVRDAKETSRRQLRAYVNLKSAHLVFGISEDGIKELWFDIVFENFGQTPAHRAVMIGEIDLGDEEPIIIAQNYGSVGPTGAIKFRQKLSLSKEGLFYLNGREGGAEPYITAQGIITYMTVFDKSATTKFSLFNDCPYFDFQSDQNRKDLGFHMAAWGDGNESS